VKQLALQLRGRWLLSQLRSWLHGLLHYPLHVCLLPFVRLFLARTISSETIVSFSRTASSEPLNSYLHSWLQSCLHSWLHSWLHKWLHKWLDHRLPNGSAATNLLQPLDQAPKHALAVRPNVLSRDNRSTEEALQIALTFCRKPLKLARSVLICCDTEASEFR
jgi:hypothetical protein